MDDDFTKTPLSGDRSSDHSSLLSLQSPPPPLAFSPGAQRSQATFEQLQSDNGARMGSMKRSRADIATPRKPGSEEARLRERMEFIDTPGRAPSASKRMMMRPDSPTKFVESDAHKMLLAETETLSIHSADSPPVRFSIGNGPASFALSSSSSSVSSSAAAAPLVKHNLGFGALVGSGSASMSINGAAAAAATARDDELNNGESAGDLVAVNQKTELGFADSINADNGASDFNSDCVEGGNSAVLGHDASFRVENGENGSNNQKTDTDNAGLIDRDNNSSNNMGDDDSDDSEIEFVIRQKPHSSDASFVDHQQQQQTTTSPFSQPVSNTTSTTPTKQVQKDTLSDNMTPALPKTVAETQTTPDRTAKTSAVATNGSTAVTSEVAVADGDTPMSPDDNRMVYDSDEDMMVTDTPIKNSVEQGSATAATPKAQTAADLMFFDQSIMDTQDKPELTSARILSDPDLLHAASVPLPVTPAMNSSQLTPKKSTPPSSVTAPGLSKNSDFMIPTDWLMSPDPKKKQSESAAVTTPPRNGAPAGGSLVSVTPVNQKLLDSLEIQWVSPRRVPKFSEVDMEEQKQSYEEKLSQRDELHRMIMESVKEEFAAKMREVEKRAEQEIRKAFETHKQQMERLVLDHAETLKRERRKHAEDIARRDEDTRIQVAELSREVEHGIAERTSIAEQRDKYQADLEQLVGLSAQMEQEKDSHIHGLEQELGNMAVERQRLTQQLNEAMSTAEELSNELEGAMKRVDDLTSENVRLDQENSTLHSDVGVAEQRNVAIKEHAEKMLATANNEIAGIHDQLNSARHEIQALKTQVTRAESRSKSLQIQLDSAKRQNEELLALCERM
ncbi:hypothetical protein GGF40_001114 [Coemansia sp. RSA 1286]|nr:hypothetical protein GGF39_001036 [Coemansia sp. RSA 1721]KAJ2639160.1 hypothetical protein GGF40_001114 [Coemansia sp. RSA 1286]